MSPETRTILAEALKQGGRQAAVDRCLAAARDDPEFLFDLLGERTPPPSPTDLAPLLPRLPQAMSRYRVHLLAKINRLLETLEHLGRK